MALRFAVVYEAPADFEIASGLADRLFVDAIDWVDEELLDSQRTWIDNADGHEFRWSRVRDLATKHRIRVHGHFDGVAGQPDAQAARRAVLTVKRLLGKVDAVVLIRDADKQPERRDGLQQARTQLSGDRIVIGLANPKREAWIICGFDPQGEREADRHAAQRQSLGFDPCLESHRLAASQDHAKTSAKRVLGELTEQSGERQRSCWSDTPLATLRSRGGSNGLAAYLDEIEQHLLPLLSPGRAV